MKKIAIITFHASYNYGSNLQAYALQEFVKKICSDECIYNIINFRSLEQKEVYKLCFEKKDFKNILKSILFLNHKKDLYERNKKFENFINNNLNVTKEYNSLDDLCNTGFDYDYYISGSDQLWNMDIADSNWAYFLEFINSKNKISYAASFGDRLQYWTDEKKERVKSDLEKYKAISVRDENTRKYVYNLTTRTAEINIDPTMLLNIEEWKKIIDDKPLIDGRYIFLYDLKARKETLRMAEKISEYLGISVITPCISAKRVFNCKLKKYYNCGPKEYLNLIKNATLVLSSSFHGTVFSILFHKPFYSFNAKSDMRLNTLLSLFNLENRSIENNVMPDLNNWNKIDFSKSDKVLEEERKKSENYLKKQLEI